MPRSIEEIDAELAEVRREKALRNALGYKQARTKAILTRDTSDLNNVYRGLNSILEREAQQEFQAAENEKSRKSTEKMAKLGKEEALQDKKDEIIKNLSINQAIWSDMKDNPSVSSGQKKQQQAIVNHWMKKANDNKIFGDEAIQAPANTGVASYLGLDDDNDLQAYTDFTTKMKDMDKLTPEQLIERAKEIEDSKYYKNTNTADAMRGIRTSVLEEADKRAGERFKSQYDQYKPLIDNPRTSDAEIQNVLDWLAKNGKNRQGLWFQGGAELEAKGKDILSKRAGGRAFIAEVKSEFKKLTPEDIGLAKAEGQATGKQASEGVPHTVTLKNGKRVTGYLVFDLPGDHGHIYSQPNRKGTSYGTF